MKVEVPADLRPSPANFLGVSHTPYDFILDFAEVIPVGDQPRAQVVARIVISPQFVHRMVETLQHNLAKYEQTFGPIKRPALPGREG
ncbi:MAG: DUF3467 domain-containing protein [Acetobacteraceae bacterium]|nr:DUF3467 domain-containing protein [Acetobacteraceae bacterium]